MSHGGNEEPNLTPMLDLVLQLVMFFMMVANFKIEEMNPGIQLPLSQSARPLDKSETAPVLSLNVDETGALLVNDSFGPRRTQGEIRDYLQTQYQLAKQQAELDKKQGAKKSDEVDTLVIIRADKRADFGAIYDVLQQTREAKFKRWQLRSNISNVTNHDS
jgi:biopolymer transport protein ExbD